MRHPIKRYVVEGHWSSYHSGQDYICHREVIKTNNPERYRAISAIGFTDGTTMTLTFREVKPKKRVTEIHGYDDLYRRAVWSGLTGYVSVDAIIAGEKKAQEIREAEYAAISAPAPAAQPVV